MMEENLQKIIQRLKQMMLQHEENKSRQDRMIQIDKIIIQIQHEMVLMIFEDEERMFNL
jgi:hypothetical protein